MAKLIGFMLGRSRHGVNDSFVAERIEALIVKNDLAVVKRAKKREDYYRATILRRSKPIEIKDLKLDVVVSSEPDDM